MNKYKSYGKGWHYESHRHSLAAKGIKTSFASENAYMNLLDSINKIYPEHDSDEQFELFGDWNRDYLTGSKAYGSLSFAAKENKVEVYGEKLKLAQPRKMERVYDIQKDVEWQIERERKTKQLIALKQDYAKRLVELEEFAKRKPTFEKEEIPDRIKFDELQRLQDEIQKLDSEINPSVVKYERHIKVAAQSLFPSEFKGKMVVAKPYG